MWFYGWMHWRSMCVSYRILADSFSIYCMCARYILTLQTATTLQHAEYSLNISKWIDVLFFFPYCFCATFFALKFLRLFYCFADPPNKYQLFSIITSRTNNWRGRCWSCLNNLAAFNQFFDNHWSVSSWCQIILVLCWEWSLQQNGWSRIDSSTCMLMRPAGFRLLISR